MNIPWYPNNQLKLLINGDAFFPVIFYSIDQAKYFIYIELYLCESSNITTTLIQHLIAARQRGVAIFLLLDGVGSMELSFSDRQKLVEQGVVLKLYNPIFRKRALSWVHRDHRKLIVMDNTVAYIGGAGFTDDFSPQYRPKKFWREMMVQVTGTLPKRMAKLFEDAWYKTSNERLTYSEVDLAISSPETISKDAITTDKVAARVVPSAGLGRQWIKRNALNRIRNADQRVWIATAYFYPSKKLRSAIKNAANRGVDVRILVPGKYSDHPAVREAGRHYYQKLLSNNVRIFEYEPRFLHIKCILCDNWISIGSCNLDRWNQKWNLEANIEVEDSHFTKQIETMLLTDLSQSQEINRERWQRRSWINKTLQAFWATIWQWIDRFVERNINLRDLRSENEKSKIENKT